METLASFLFTYSLLILDMMNGKTIYPLIRGKLDDHPSRVQPIP